MIYRSVLKESLWRRLTGDLKGKNTSHSAKGGKQKTRREANWICFPNAVTFLAGAQAGVLAKRVWEGGVEVVKEEEGGLERAHCFSYLRSVSFFSHIQSEPEDVIYRCNLNSGLRSLRRGANARGSAVVSFVLLKYTWPHFTPAGISVPLLTGRL